MSLKKFIPITIAIPSIAIGALAMYHNHIPIAIWGQNIACLVLMIIVSLVMANHKLNLSKSRYRKIVLPALLGLLILAFASQGMEGVHRWVSIGPLKFNIAMIVLPIILIELWNKLQTNDLGFVFSVALVIVLVLFFQPDASQLTGFAIPMMIMLSRKTNNKLIRFLVISTFSLFAFFSWVRLDNLPPVSYVERILNMVANMGFAWLILGVFSLSILPLPFFLFPPKNAESISRYIGFYYVIIILSTIFGNFPVPLMGYGMSPIIGFYISLIWLRL